ncbi:MAG: PCMD domain-containing protein [Marinifilaceae bacterium]
MRQLFVAWMCVLGLCLGSCTKIDRLSDFASVESFEVTDYWPKSVLLDSVVMMKNIISVPVVYGVKDFPLTVAYNVKFSSTTEDVLDSPFKSDTIVFNNINDVKNFILVSESGVPHKWSLCVDELQNKEITQFSVLYMSNATRIGKPFFQNDIIGVKVTDVTAWPVRMYVYIKVSEGAVIDESTYVQGEMIELHSFDDEKPIKVISSDGDEKIWKIKVISTPPNKDFERWVSETEIDPMPGKGMGWTTANNNFVKGVKRVANDGSGSAARISTSRQNLSFMGIDLIAAGTLFLGEFNFNLSCIERPREMTNFGIPFDGTPKEVRVRAKYSPGAALKQAIKEGNKWRLIDVAGADCGHVWVKLLQWNGKGDLEYHKDPKEGLVVIAEGEYVFDGSDSAFKDCVFPMKYYYPNITPTHVAVVFTSSIEGDTFCGAVGSELIVDCIDFIY